MYNSWMSSYSIQLNTLGAPGTTPLDLQQIHRKRAEASLSKYLLKDRQVQSFFHQLGSETNFNFTIGRKGVEIALKEGNSHFFKLDPKTLKQLRKIGRISQFYSHVAGIEKPMDAARAVLQRQVTKAKVKEITQSSIPGTKGNILTLTAVSENTLSLVRDVLRAIPKIGPSHIVPHNLGFAAGAIWTAFGVREVKGGYSDYKRAEQIQDKEGRNRAVGRLTTGSLGTVGSVFFLSGKATTSANAAALTATTLSFIGDLFFGIGSVVGIGLSSLGVYRCSTFRKRLNEYYKNPELSKEQQVRGTLSFLKDLLSVTPAEQAELIAKINEENPHLSLQEKEALLKQKLVDLTEVKVKYLKRRTSNKSLELILNRVEPLLAKLNDPAALEEADALIQTVLKENKAKMVLYLVGLIFSVVSLIGVIMADFFSLGTAPFIVMGVASFVFLMITAYNFIVQLMKKDPDSGPMIMVPLDAQVV